MARLNPYTDKVEQEATETRSFVDAKQSSPLELTMLRPHDDMIHVVIEEKAQDNIAEYIGHPEKIPPVQGQRVHITRGVCKAIAILQILQSAQNEEKPYDFAEWAVMFKTRTSSMAEVMGWVTNLLRGTDKDLKKE